MTGTNLNGRRILYAAKNDLRDAVSSSIVAVEIKRSLAKKLLGQTFAVRHEYGTHTYEITQDSRDDWHEFEWKEDTLCGEE